MTWWQCPRCKRRGEPEDARQYWERGDRDQPGYWEDSCKRCTPDADELEAASDAYWDRRMDEERA